IISPSSPRRCLAVKRLMTRSISPTACISSVMLFSWPSAAGSSTSSPDSTVMIMSVPPNSSPIFLRLMRVESSAGSWFFISVSSSALGSCSAKNTVMAVKIAMDSQRSRTTRFANRCMGVSRASEGEPELRVARGQGLVDEIEQGADRTGIDFTAEIGDQPIADAIADLGEHQPLPRGEVHEAKRRQRQRVVQRQPFEPHGGQVLDLRQLLEQRLVAN